MNKKYTYSVLAMVLGLATQTSSAAALFSIDTIGSFYNPVAGVTDYIEIENDDDGFDADDSAYFAWGTTAYKRTCNPSCSYSPDVDSQHSEFFFDGKGSDFDDSAMVSANTAFSLGSFTYTNRSVYYAKDVNGISLDLELDIEDFDYVNFSVDFTIDNTSNSPIDVADFMSADFTSSSIDFDYQGSRFILEILGFSQDGGNLFMNEASVDEHTTMKAEIYAIIHDVQPSPVPVPAAVWLFGSGLLGLTALIRRK